MFWQKNGILTAKYNGETVRIEAWGKDSLRIRTTVYPQFTDQDWALTEKTDGSKAKITISKDGKRFY